MWRSRRSGGTWSATSGGRSTFGDDDDLGADVIECSHRDQIRDVEPSAAGCEDCLRIGGQWVHLRLCLICGHVGCCDQSPNRHASGHFRETGHPIIRSFEPGEDWAWCFVDEVYPDLTA